MTIDASQSAAPYPRRFGWGMRVFLTLFLFDMLYRSTFWTLGEFSWGPELDRERPMALPSQAELESIDDGKHHEGYTTRSERFAASFRSAAQFAVPRPKQPIESPIDFGLFATHWVMNRLVFIGHLTGNDQTWQMFSHVPPRRIIPRVRLLYEDGTVQDFYGWSHPADFTRMSHWFEEKRLQVELNALDSIACMRGYSNWLVHHRGVNDSGSRLKTIEFSKFYFQRSPPGVSTRDSFRKQSARPADQTGPVYWRFDVRSGTGRYIAPDS